MELAVEEVTLVEAAIKNEVTATSLFAVDEIANELDFVVVPRFGALPVLLVVNPLALIHATVDVDEDAETFGLAVPPLALVNVAVCMSHATFAVEEAILCLTVVGGAIREDDDADSLPNTLFV